MTRPLIAIPARFSNSAAALRYEAEVSARKLMEAVFAAGGEPLSVHPRAPDGRVKDREVAERLAFADGVLLPGGGDIHPAHYGAGQHDSLYDVDLEQDAFDLSVARWCLHTGRPLLAICRGLQIVNVATGGTLLPDLSPQHRHVLSQLTLREGTEVQHVLGRRQITISCYHHQAVDQIGTGLRVTALADDGVIEAIELEQPTDRWLLAVQWHPEDTAATDLAQQALFDGLVAAARPSTRTPGGQTAETEPRRVL